MTKLIVNAICISIMALTSITVLAADNKTAKSVASSNSDATHATILLDRAVKYYLSDGKEAFAAFSRMGEFVDGDLYVYVVSNDGVMQASGGPSLALVGRNVRELKDVGGKLFIKEMMENDKASDGSFVEYRWLNREDGKVEKKVTYYRKVGDVIIAVGYYIPRAAPKEAKALLKRAIEATSKDVKSAIVRFSDMNGGFVEDDLYVFVVGLDDKVMYAHGAIPRLIGQNVDDLRDINGKPIIRQMIEIVKVKGSGELKYVWPNPVTHKQEHKTTYFQRVDGYLVAVGNYTR